MLKVIGRKTSVNVQRVMWTIGELGLKSERTDAGGPFGGLDTPEFGKLNPNRLVPVIDDDGFTLWESQAIVRYLAAAYGKGTLSPADPKALARADQWMEWSSTSLYADLIPGLFIGLIRTPAADRNAALMQAATERTGKRMEILDRELKSRPFITGDTLTIADIGVGVLLYRYFNLPIARPAVPNAEAYFKRLGARPAYQEHVMIDFQAMKVAGA